MAIGDVFKVGDRIEALRMSKCLLPTTGAPVWVLLFDFGSGAVGENTGRRQNRHI
jgi:hypothetical protein